MCEEKFPGKMCKQHRPSGSAARAEVVMSKADSRGCAFVQGRRIRPKPFPVKRSGPLAGSLTRGAERQAVFNLPRALWPRGGAAPAGDCWGYRASPGDAPPRSKRMSRPSSPPAPGREPDGSRRKMQEEADKGRSPHPSRPMAVLPYPFWPSAISP